MKCVAFAPPWTFWRSRVKNSPAMSAYTFRVFDQTFIERKVTKFPARHTVVEYKIRRRANSTGIRKKRSVLLARRVDFQDIKNPLTSRQLSVFRFNAYIYNFIEFISNKIITIDVTFQWKIVRFTRRFLVWNDSETSMEALITQESTRVETEDHFGCNFKSQRMLDARHCTRVTSRRVRPVLFFSVDVQDDVLDILPETAHCHCRTTFLLKRQCKNKIYK